ncbi:MAG: hypothetical protein V7618_08915 [Rhodoglobus sp.]|uniref:hypothetical protein n=1 Tax=uncultured Salinibacterium sp. TaxID=459274 RepID=UPI0030DD462B|tara:strand:+ start:19025 stop:19579 length:555 start_codon:yes stop_codon:yes gene_type:complete
MRFSNLAPLTIGVLLLASLSGCAPSGTPESPEPTATFVAPYATDEEALAAAEEAYAEYLRVSNEILHAGGTDPERLSTVAVGPFLDSSIDSFKEQQAEGHIVTGKSSIRSVELQRYSRTGPSREMITVYLCEDLSLVDVMDSKGKSVVSPDRGDSILLQVTFDFVESSSALMVAGSEKWSDEPC